MRTYRCAKCARVIHLFEKVAVLLNARNPKGRGLHPNADNQVVIRHTERILPWGLVRPQAALTKHLCTQLNHSNNWKIIQTIKIHAIKTEIFAHSVLGPRPSAGGSRKYLLPVIYTCYAHTHTHTGQKETVFEAASILRAAASKYSTRGLDERMGSVIERYSTVPTAEEASMGVKIK